jgi:hypothetical protein
MSLTNELTQQETLNCVTLVREWGKYREKKNVFSTSTCYEGSVGDFKVVVKETGRANKTFNVSIYSNNHMIGECDSKKHPQYINNLITAIVKVENECEQRRKSTIDKISKQNNLQGRL